MPFAARLEEFARRATSHGYTPNPRIPASDLLQRANAQELHQTPSQLVQGCRSLDLPLATRSLTCWMRQQGRDVRQSQTLRQSLIDPFGSRIEGGVGAVNGHARGDQSQQHATDNGIGCQSLDRRKGQRKVRNDHIGAADDCLIDGCRCDRQASHKMPHFRTTFTN